MAKAQRFLRFAAVLALAAALSSGARAYDPSKRSPGKIAGTAFVPAVPPATQLGSDPAVQCPRSAVLADLEKKLADLAKQKKLPLAEKDGQLCEVADTFLGWKDDGQVPPHLAAAVAQHLGLPLRPEVRLASFESSAPENITPALLETLGGLMAGAAHPRFGLVMELKRGGSARVRTESARIALAMLDAPVDFQPFPRKLDLGASATVSGQILGDWTSVKVQTSDELGKLDTPEQPPGKAFKAELRCADKPGGRATAEIRGEDAMGMRTLATVVVQCGGELPTSFPIARAAWPKDLPGQEQRMAEAVNADREAIGLPALEADPALAGVARTVAEQLRDAIAAGKAPQVDTGGLLKEAGLASPILLQNPGEAPSGEEAQTRFSLSPSTRQNILNPDVNRMGVGLASSTDTTGRPTVVAVQLFTKVLPPVDVAQVKKDFYAEVQKRREEAKAPAASVDPAIDRVMQKYAEAMAGSGGKLPNDQADEITHPLRAPYKAINMIEGAKGSIADFLKESTVTWDGSAMGVGIAQGTHPVLGKNALFIAFVVATPRGTEGAKPAPAAGKPKPKPVPVPKKK